VDEMKKYLQVIKSTIDEVTTYRFNFTMWRFRNVLQLLTVYFLWFTVTPQQGQIFGYSQSAIITYVLGASILGSVVLSTRTHEIGENINNGDLSMFLAKPWSYFGYWFARDIGDKAFNIGFSIFELIILYLILKPTLVLSSDPGVILLTVAAVFLAVLINFLIGCLMGMVGFWSSDVWAPRFIFFILVGFLAGGAFPLDIFPGWIQNAFQYSPFTYLLYFPLKIYLESLTIQQVLNGFVAAASWVVLLYLATFIVWRRGLKMYSGHGG
jgi:ABC-2 type transport system permease protein